MQVQPITGGDTTLTPSPPSDAPKTNTTPSSEMLQHTVISRSILKMLGNNDTVKDSRYQPLSGKLRNALLSVLDDTIAPSEQLRILKSLFEEVDVQRPTTPTPTLRTGSNSQNLSELNWSALNDSGQSASGSGKSLPPSDGITPSHGTSTAAESEQLRRGNTAVSTSSTPSEADSSSDDMVPENPDNLPTPEPRTVDSEESDDMIPMRAEDFPAAQPYSSLMSQVRQSAKRQETWDNLLSASKKPLMRPGIHPRHRSPAPLPSLSRPASNFPAEATPSLSASADHSKLLAQWPSAVQSKQRRIPSSAAAKSTAGSEAFPADTVWQLADPQRFLGRAIGILKRDYNSTITDAFNQQWVKMYEGRDGSSPRNMFPINRLNPKQYSAHSPSGTPPGPKSCLVTENALQQLGNLLKSAGVSEEKIGDIFRPVREEQTTFTPGDLAPQQEASRSLPIATAQRPLPQHSPLKPTNSPQNSSGQTQSRVTPPVVKGPAREIGNQTPANGSKMESTSIDTQTDNIPAKEFSKFAVESVTSAGQNEEIQTRGSESQRSDTSEISAADSPAAAATFPAETIWQVDNSRIFFAKLLMTLGNSNKPAAEALRQQLDELWQGPLWQSANSLSESQRTQLDSPNENTILLLEPAIQALEGTLTTVMSRTHAQTLLAPLRQRQSTLSMADLYSNS